MRDSFENHRLRSMVWIIQTIEREGSITLKRLNELWLENEDLSGGVEMLRRTFINYKNAIWDLFNIEIVCDNRNGFKYSIGVRDDGEMTKWLINSVLTNEIIARNADMKNRIMLEPAYSGEEYLRVITDAMRDSKKIAFTYKRFHDLAPQHIKGDPYCVRLYHQRWYVVVKEYRTVLASHEIVEELRVYSFDRMSELQTLDEKFKMDKNFSAQDFFKYAWGVRVEKGNEPMKVVLKVSAVQRDYFRTLPLHHSQVEVETAEDYSIFEYYVAYSVELVMQILQYGNLVEVLAPEDLRGEIAFETYGAAMQYSEYDDEDEEEIEIEGD